MLPTASGSRWMTPFLRLTTACPRGKHLKTFLEPFAAGGVPVTVQLMGVDPDVIGEAAARFCDLGAAGINLNFGCPSRQVTSGGAGGGALPPSRRPPPDGRTGEELSARPPAERQTPHRLEFAGGGAPSPARTGAHQNGYFFTSAPSPKDTPRPKAGKRGSVAIADLGAVPCIVNGDLRSAEEARTQRRRHRRFPRDGGPRFRNPWLLRRIAGETDPETGISASLPKFFPFRAPRAIELSQFLWGRDNPWFDRLRQFPRAQR